MDFWADYRHGEKKIVKFSRYYTAIHLNLSATKLSMAKKKLKVSVLPTGDLTLLTHCFAAAVFR